MSETHKFLIDIKVGIETRPKFLIIFIFVRSYNIACPVENFISMFMDNKLWSCL